MADFSFCSVVIINETRQVVKRVKMGTGKILGRVSLKQGGGRSFQTKKCSWIPESYFIDKIFWFYNFFTLFLNRVPEFLGSNRNGESVRFLIWPCHRGQLTGVGIVVRPLPCAGGTSEVLLGFASPPSGGTSLDSRYKLLKSDNSQEENKNKHTQKKPRK